jgi:hypothetical protein
MIRKTKEYFRRNFLIETDTRRPPKKPVRHADLDSYKDAPARDGVMGSLQLVLVEAKGLSFPGGHSHVIRDLLS